MLNNFKRRYLRRRCEKYEYLLLYDKLRLPQVPASIRLNLSCASTIHIAALRTSRAISLNRFDEDIRFIAHEIAGLNYADPVKAVLQLRLEEYRDMRDWIRRKFECRENC